MKFQPLGIQGAWLIESKVFKDERGSFREWFKSGEIRNKIGIDFSVAQANVSTSARGVIRGIHYSLAREGQSKWVTCTSGRILDVIVDIRPDSPTFKHVEYIELHGSRATFIGPGLGHGFISLEDKSVVTYLLSSPYSPEFEFGIHPTDSELNIDWEVDSILESSFLLSPKDLNAPTLAERFAEGKLPK
jgi:dTDP-4-dehydrorhamnose 3,5-epimerase